MFYAIVGLLGVLVGVIGIDKLRDLVEEVQAGGTVALLPALAPFVGVAIVLYAWKGGGQSAERIAALGGIISLIALLYVMQTYYGAQD